MSRFSRGRASTRARSSSSTVPFESPEPPVFDRKAAQVCREALRTITETLSASADPLLSSLTVLAVEPAPDASRLMVVVGLPPTRPGGPSNPADVVAHLAERRGLLRADLAASLQRKRTPELTFFVLPARRSEGGAP